MTFKGEYEYPLGIPIPECMVCLPRQPPVCHFTTADLETLDVIRNFGQEFGCPEIEIQQALNLASGPSDLVIILQRPASNHDYTVSFEKFVQDCPTLEAVDELIQFATKGARSIHTVTVLDAYMFKPKRRVGIPDERCHQILADIIDLKSPRVILRCHNDLYHDSRLKRLELPCEDYNMRVILDNEPTQYLIQSFHPSVAVNYNGARPEFRILLLYHFTWAFSRLGLPNDKFKPPKFVRVQCTLKADWDSLKKTDAVKRIAEILNPAPKRPSTGYMFPGTLQDMVHERNSYDSMYKQLAQLSISHQKLGAFDICRALRLWRDHFSDHCLYKQVTSLLLCKGSEQSSWCRSKNLEDASLSIDEITSGISEIQVQGTETAQRIPYQTGENDHEQNIDPVYLHGRIKYAEEQCEVESRPTMFSPFNLTHSLKICRLVSWLKYQIQLFETDKAKEDRLDNFENEVASFFKASDELKAMVEV